jgi:hypothetical protein
MWTTRSDRGSRIHLVRMLVTLALVLPACASHGAPATGSQTSKVTELHSVSELQERFNEDSGRVRLILLISPT